MSYHVIVCRDTFKYRLSSDYIVSYHIILHYRVSWYITSYTMKSYHNIIYHIIHNGIISCRGISQHISHHIESSRVASHHSNERSYIKHRYARNVYQSLPESVVSPGIALAISDMTFPSCCIRDTVGADVGINVGAEIKVLDIDHYFIVCNSLDYPRYHISAFIRLYQDVNVILIVLVLHRWTSTACNINIHIPHHVIAPHYAAFIDRTVHIRIHTI